MGNGSSEGKQETVFFDEDGGSWVPWDIVQGMIDSALARAKASGVAIPESMGSLVVVEVNGQEAVYLHDVVQFFASAPSCVWDNLPDDWKSEFLTPDIWPPPVCLTPEQREAVARYLTTAPEIPRIVQRFPIGFGVTPEERLPPNWGPDDLVRWICEKTDRATGKRYLTADGYRRALELYKPDPMAAAFSMMQVSGKGGPPPPSYSLPEYWRLFPDDSGWPPLSTVQQDMCTRYIRPFGGCETVRYMNPHPDYLWTRYQVYTEALPADFDAAALVRRVLEEKRRGLVKLTPEALDWARKTGLLASGLPEVPLADSGKDLATVSEAQVYDAMTLLKLADSNPRLRLQLLVSTGNLPPDFTTADLLRHARAKGWEWTRAGYERAEELGLMGNPAAPAAVQTHGRLAADVGATSWQELEFRVLASGLEFRRAGMGSDFIRKTWGALNLKGRRVVCGLLIDVAQHRGTLPKDREADKRRQRVIILNKALRGAFGLPDNPFHNDRRLGTQTVIGAISWGGKP